ncbi:MAG: hypothetical protein NTW07_10950 [candidate division Zixibacteria bacterium]|nr:hypothetical protein [candidate division Zixibacteria bacterium]
MNDLRARHLAEQAQAIYLRHSSPIGMIVEITRKEFHSVYTGEGSNAAGAPLDEIIPQAGALALFAVTLGEQVCDEISRLFEQNDFAGGAMLDAAASLGADLAAGEIERRCDNQWQSSHLVDDRMAVMRFSPGYCGWHVSGQKKLFARLQPERIGIRLNDSDLMQPLKSVSGVIVAAPRRVFDIDDTYLFCADCKTHSCRDRFNAISEKHQPDDYRK